MQTLSMNLKTSLGFKKGQPKRLLFLFAQKSRHVKPLPALVNSIATNGLINRLFFLI